MQRTYVGPLAHGLVQLPGRAAPFKRGEPIEVTEDEAKHLHADEWEAPKAPAKAKTTKPTEGEA